MIAKRIASSLLNQNWVAFFIELVLVIAGVLIALQLDQWKEARAENVHEFEFLKKVRTDIETDVVDLTDNVKMLAAVTSFGYTAMEALEGRPCIDQCWSELVAIFQASQWIDVELNQTSYEDIKRTGLPRDMALRNELVTYYNVSDQARKISADLPRFRELIRSSIPARTQEYMWGECFSVQGRKQSLNGDCAPPPNADQSLEVITRLRANPEIRTSLTYWLSTVSILKNMLHEQVSEAETVIDDLSRYLDSRQ